MMPAYTLRPAIQADYDFLYDLNRRTMRAYVEPLWGWDEARQREIFRQNFRLEGHSIIMVEGHMAGRLALDRGPERLFIAQINLLPAYQGKGIGTSIIRTLQAEAVQNHIPLELRVLQTNPDARRLYERLGFTVSNENETHLWMRWQPEIG